jgi:hypothetical protein
MSGIKCTLPDLAHLANVISGKKGQECRVARRLRGSLRMVKLRRESNTLR